MNLSKYEKSHNQSFYGHRCTKLSWSGLGVALIMLSVTPWRGMSLVSTLRSGGLVSCYFFVFGGLFGHTLSMCKFLGLGLNPHHSCNRHRSVPNLLGHKGTAVFVLRQFLQVVPEVLGILTIHSSDFEGLSSAKNVYRAYLFPIAALTNYHLVTWEQHMFVILQFWTSEV